MLKISKFARKVFFGTILTGIAATILLVVHLEANLPSVEVLKEVQLQVPLKIYTADGKLLAEYGEKRRTPLTLDQMPKKLIDAVLATEDRRFYQHPGVDMRGLLRAVVSLVTKGTKEQGGSTITMQVARNFFLTRTKTYSRKLNEILLALKIEQELTKDEILELYLNKIYFGKRAYGIAAAAEVYYGTTVDNLTLAQIAMLAGLPQAPSAINPLNSPESAIKRRSHVLERMLNYNLITRAEYDEAMQQPINTTYHGRPIEVNAPYVAEMVRQQIVNMYGETAYDQGYQVITTISSDNQNAANQALARAILEYDQRHGYRGPIKKINLSNNNLSELKDVPTVNNLIPAVITEVRDQEVTALLKTGLNITIPWSGFAWADGSATTAHDILHEGHVVYVAQQNDKWFLAQVPEVEGALVAVNPNTGAIISLVGGFDYEKSSFNRAIQASRQPGSSFKPFIYAAALENGFTFASLMNDAPVVNDDPSGDEWRPQNYTREFNGLTRIRVGLTQSMNLVSIRLLQALGVRKAIDYISNLGLPTKSLPKGLSLALGTNLLSPLDLAIAYSAFPNGGHKIEPYYIKQIIDYQGNIIYQAAPPAIVEATEDTPSPTQVMSPQVAYMISSALQDVIKVGTGKRALQLGRKDLAGKTGTTNDQLDGWFAGYNRDLVVTTWMGYDEPQSLREYGSGTALPMWIYFMEKALKGKPEHFQPQPPGLVTVRIDPVTGLLARSGQSNAVFELFIENTAPTSVATEHQSNNIGAGANEAGQIANNLEVETIF